MFVLNVVNFLSRLFLTSPHLIVLILGGLVCLLFMIPIFWSFVIAIIFDIVFTIAQGNVKVDAPDNIFLYDKMSDSFKKNLGSLYFNGVNHYDNYYHIYGTIMANVITPYNNKNIKIPEVNERLDCIQKITKNVVGDMETKIPGLISDIKNDIKWYDDNRSKLVDDGSIRSSFYKWFVMFMTN